MSLKTYLQSMSAELKAKSVVEINAYQNLHVNQSDGSVTWVRYVDAQRTAVAEQSTLTGQQLFEKLKSHYLAGTIRVIDAYDDLVEAI